MGPNEHSTLGFNQSAREFVGSHPIRSTTLELGNLVSMINVQAVAHDEFVDCVRAVLQDDGLSDRAVVDRLKSALERFDRRTNPN